MAQEILFELEDFCVSRLWRKIEIEEEVNKETKYECSNIIQKIEIK